MDRSVVLAVADAETTTVEGRFQRHASLGHRKLTGSAAGGRWGPAGAYPVVYLGRPMDSIIAEAHRHLVEPIEGMRPELVGPRRLLTCEVWVTSVLDLRVASNQEIVGLSADELTSAIDAHEPCQRVGQAAHQLGLHGVIAPAATGLGETLALFERRLPAKEQPQLVDEVVWEHLPRDPRQQRVTRG
jgi:hypothetical protein